MINFQLISLIVGISAGLGIFVMGIGYAYSQFKAGASKAKDDLITTLKEQADAQTQRAERVSLEKTELIKNHQEQINLLNKDLGILQGRIDEQAKKTEEYKALLQGRDPQQFEMLQKILAQLELLNKHNAISHKRNQKMSMTLETNKGGE